MLLGRYARSDDVVTGTPLGNRTHPELEGLIGYFDNSAALRTDLSGALALKNSLSSQTLWEANSSKALTL